MTRWRERRFPRNAWVARSGSGRRPWRADLSAKTGQELCAFDAKAHRSGLICLRALQGRHARPIRLAAAMRRGSRSLVLT